MPDVAQKSAELVGRLERLPFSRWHRNLFILCFVGVMFDAADFALFGMALPPVAREFGLNQAQAGLLATVGLVGAFLGALFWGTISDYIGRRTSFASTIGIFSLFTGLVAAFLSLSLGLLAGTLAGFRGGWLDALLMRGGELFLALPWLYLLLGVRAFLPLHISTTQAFFLLIAIIGTIGALDFYRLPDAKGYASMQRHLVGETDASLQRQREEVLGTTAADIRAFGDAMATVAKKGRIAVLGSEPAIVRVGAVQDFIEQE